MTDEISADWPAIPYADWQPTAAALHLYLQIVGKYRLARSPWINHSWHATFYVTPRGLTTSMIPDGDSGIEVFFDFAQNVLRGTCGSGRTLDFGLQPMTVAEFHRKFTGMIAELGGNASFHGSPNELPDPVPFAGDTLAVTVRRDHYRAYLYVTVDGEPSDTLPQDDRGAYLVLTSPDYQPHLETLPIASGLEAGQPHSAGNRFFSRVGPWAGDLATVLPEITSKRGMRSLPHRGPRARSMMTSIGFVKRWALKS